MISISYPLLQTTSKNLYIAFSQHKAIQVLINDLIVFDSRGLHNALFFESRFFKDTHRSEIKIKDRSKETFKVMPVLCKVHNQH